MIPSATDKYFHPSTVDEVRELILLARSQGLNLRVRGSGHSVKASFEATSPAPINVMLDRMRSVRITPEPDGASAVVEVEAGCNLGLDPNDPAGVSTWTNSLNAQMHEAGWALPSLGGISHQTVAGFLITGSAGGSTTRSASGTVLRIEFVDGLGEVRRVGVDDSGRQRDLFEAVGVSMGLLGVITKVWLRAVPAYGVTGREVTTNLEECPVDLFGHGSNGRPGLGDFLESTPFCRVLWWPQLGFDRVQVWSGEPNTKVESRPFQILSAIEVVSGAALQTAVGHLPDLKNLPQKLEEMGAYRSLESLLAGGKPFEKLTYSTQTRSESNPGAFRRVLAKAVASLTRALVRLGSTNALSRAWGRRVERRMPERIHRLMALYIEDGVKEFADAWLTALPMDNQLEVNLWPGSFAELWIPIEKTAEAMQTVRELFERADPKTRYRLSKASTLEIYAGPESPFWLSPGYRQRSIRINPMWLEQWPGDRVDEVFGPYFDALQPYAFRPHWGKWLPHPSPSWRSYYRETIPRFGEFLALRAELDPDRVFVNEYWRDHLGL